MYWVGIDVAKDSHSAAVLDFQGRRLGTLDFPNDSEGFASLLSFLLLTCDGVYGVCYVCMEATGHYWRNLARFLSANGCVVAVVNPMQVEAFRKAETVRKVKTDRIDAVLIADFARFKGLSLDYRRFADSEGVKRLTRYRSHLVRERTQLKNRLAAAVDELFPALPKLLGGTSSATFLAVVAEYGSPLSIASSDVHALAGFLSSASRGRYGLDRAEALHDAAALNVGASDDHALAFELRHLAEMVSFYNSKIAEVDREIASLSSGTDYDLLRSIPGIGPLGASVILGEVGDPSRFRDGKALMAYAGMDASVRESGKHKGKEAHMSKRGSAHLRRILMLCADAARRNDDYFRVYYDSLRSRDKHHYVAVSAVARKLCGVILAVLRERRPYECREPIQSTKPFASIL